MQLTDLIIPTNPQFDWSVPAAQQLEFVNPVTLSNYEIRLANYALTVTQSIVAINRKIRDAKEALKEAKHALEDFRYELLRAAPPPATATKSLALLEAYTRRAVVVAGSQDEYKALRSAVNAAERNEERLDIERENSQQVWDCIKLMGIHAQTHLSFVKSDLKQSGRYT